MTVEAVSLWSLGALLGLRHALEPDHLVAVSTLIAGRAGPRSALHVGAAWGVGHTLALLAVASVLALARGQLSPALAAGFELGVGVMLIALGVQSLRRARGEGGAGRAATGPKVERANEPERPARPGWPPARRALLVGTAHGLAGSGALTALIAAQFPSLVGRIGYVAVFGAGSLIGMAGLSGLAGVPLGRARRRPALRRALSLAGGAVAIALGLVWIVREARTLLG